MEVITVESVHGKTVVSLRDTPAGKPRYVVAPTFGLACYVLGQHLLPQWWQRAGVC